MSNTPVAPGLRHDLSNDDYHAITDWLSSSQLKAALPEHYKTGGSTEALGFGTLVHSVVLEPDSLGHYVVLDAHQIAGTNPRTGKPYDAPTMTAKWKAAVAEAEQDGKTVVAAEDWRTAHAMRDAVAAHPTAAQLLMSSDGVSEESVFAVDANGVRHKARFDRRIPGAIVDLKTTSAKPGSQSLTRAVLDYGYDLSAAHYLAVAELAELDADTFLFVFVGKAEPYRVTVARLAPEFLARGALLRDLAIDRLNGNAPAYEGATGELTLTPPPWARIAPASGLTETDFTISSDFSWSLNEYA